MTETRRNSRANAQTTLVVKSAIRRSTSSLHTTTTKLPANDVAEVVPADAADDDPGNARGLDGQDGRPATRGLGAGVLDQSQDEDQATPPRQVQSHITSQFEPTSRASHGLMQLREKGDKKVGMEVCTGAWTGGRYGLLFEDEGKRKRRDWESSSGEEDDDDDMEDLGEGEVGGAEVGEKAGKVADAALLADTVPATDAVPMVDAVPVADAAPVADALPAAMETEPNNTEEAEPQMGVPVADARDDNNDNNDNNDNEDEADEVDLEIILSDPDEELDELEGGHGLDHVNDDNHDNQETVLVQDQSRQRVDAGAACSHQTQHASPQSLSLRALPQSAETTPTLMVALSARFFDEAENAQSVGNDEDGEHAERIERIENEENDENDENDENARTAAVATVPPDSTTTTITSKAGGSRRDRLSRAIIGLESETAIRTMLERGFSVADGAPCTMPPPLLCACMDDSERNANIVAALVEHQVDMNEAHVEDGFTPLMQSVKTGSLSMVGLLLRAGADLRRTCKNGRSALFVAIQLGKTAAARSIVSAMCDAKIDVDELRVDNGRTALMEAASRGQGDVAAVLVEAGADVSLVDDEQRTALMLCLDNGHASKKLFGLLMSEASINRADQAGKTPLEIAISRKSMPVAEMLAADGRYDIGKTFSKTTPLIHAIVNEGGTRLVRKLLDRGASPDEVDPVDGKTPMMYAAELGESQIIHDLIKADANPRLELEGGNGWNALMFAARHGHASAARVLQNAMGIRPPERTRMVVAADGGKNANV